VTAWTCDDVRRNLEWFVGDDLDAGSAAQVRAHLRECVVCRNDAASLQQAIKGLRGLATAGHPDVDDAMFTAMHASIVERIDAESHALGRVRGRGWWRVLPLAAAAAVFAIGWWSVRGLDGGSVFDRPPLGTLVDHGVPVKVVPWSGPRVPLQPLGDERSEPDAASGGVGPGMMGRWRLRTLEGVDPSARSATPQRVDVPDEALRLRGR